jgi:hypothetical protein
MDESAPVANIEQDLSAENAAASNMSGPSIEADIQSMPASNVPGPIMTEPAPAQDQEEMSQIEKDIMEMGLQ